LVVVFFSRWASNLVAPLAVRAHTGKRSWPNSKITKPKVSQAGA